MCVYMYIHTSICMYYCKPVHIHSQPAMEQGYSGAETCGAKPGFFNQPCLTSQRGTSICMYYCKPVHIHSQPAMEQGYSEAETREAESHFFRQPCLHSQRRPDVGLAQADPALHIC